MELLGTLLPTIPELNWIGKIQCLLTEQGDWSDQYGSDKYSVVDITWEQLPDTIWNRHGPANWHPMIQ